MPAHASGRLRPSGNEARRASCSAVFGAYRRAGSSEGRTRSSMSGQRSRGVAGNAGAVAVCQDELPHVDIDVHMIALPSLSSVASAHSSRSNDGRNVSIVTRPTRHLERAGPHIPWRADKPRAVPAPAGVQMAPGVGGGGIVSATGAGSAMSSEKERLSADAAEPVRATFNSVRAATAARRFIFGFLRSAACRVLPRQTKVLDRGQVTRCLAHTR